MRVYYLIFCVCLKISGVSRFADIFLLSSGPRFGFNPSGGAFEKNIYESIHAVTNF